MTRSIVAAGLACIASWLGLLIGAGNVGLQRSVAVGPHTLLEVPLAIVLAITLGTIAVTAVGVAVGSTDGLLVLAFVVIGDLVGAAILVPMAVGELEIVHAPAVFAVLTTFGLQPLAAAGGGQVAARLTAGRTMRP